MPIVPLEGSIKLPPAAMRLVFVAPSFRQRCLIRLYNLLGRVKEAKLW